MRRLLLAGLVVVWGTLGVDAATRYIDYTGGSDANAGTSTAAPWKRAPGMKGVTGTAAAYVASPGDIFIFKGGVTWPVSAFQWSITRSGSAGNPITYKSDAAWFAGGSFSLPLFDFQHTLVGAGWTQAAGVLVAASYITFDGLELANHRAPRNVNGVSSWGSNAITIDNASNFTLTNCTVRDWDQPTTGTPPAGVIWDGGGGITRVNNGGSHVVSNCLFHQDNVTQKSGAAIWNIGTISDTEIRNTPTAIQFAQTVHDCNIHDLPDPADPEQHSNVIIGYDFTAYNNVIHDIAARAQIIFSTPGQFGAGTLLVYNNVVYNVAQPCVAIDTDGSNNPGAAARVYNNTLVGAGGSGLCIRVIYRANGAFPTLAAFNNHYVTSGLAVGVNNTAAGYANVTSYTQGNNVTQTQPQANAAGYTTSNDYAPLDATKPTVIAATDLSAYFTTDILSNPRPSTAGLWNVGAYAFVPTTGVPGTIVLSAASATVAEDGVSITVTAKRTGGSSGIVGASYGTANGSAIAGVNYTTTSGTLTWPNGDSSDKTFVVSILNVPFYGSKSFTATLSSPTGGATLGTPATQTIAINGVGSAPIVVLPGLSWASPSDLAAPFTSSGAYYSQSIQTTTPSSAGIANYYFTNVAGTYIPYVELIGPSDSENSLYFAGLGTTPVESDNVFDINPPVAVRTELAISQRGPTGTPTFANTNAVQLYLAGGVTNQLQLRGREPNVRIYNLRLQLVSEPPPVDPPMVLTTTLTNIDGYYKATTNLVALVQFTTNVTVTGTPLLSLNSGGTLTNTGGSGTDTLRFEGTIQPGENAALLDYDSTTALEPNGGTIKFGTVDAVLTLPDPGAANSLSHGRTVVVDTTAPTTTISAASTTLTSAGGTVFYTVTYYDANFNVNTLVDSNVTLNGTTTGTIVVGPNNTGPSVAVTLSALTVGTGSISIASGTAVDLAGNLAPAAGPSAGFSVTSAFGGTANVISTSAGVVITNP